jgi:hypothetical protein
MPTYSNPVRKRAVSRIYRGREPVVGAAEKPQALERGLSDLFLTAAFSGPTPCCHYWRNKLAGSLAFFGRGEQPANNG